MNSSTKKLLEYDNIKERLKGFAISDIGREMIDKLNPSVNINMIKKWMNETSEAKALVNRSSSIPLHSLTGIKGIMEKLGKDALLNPEDLSSISVLLKDGEKLKRFMLDKASIAPIVSSYAQSIYELNEVSSEIERCIVNCRVDDNASSELAKTRRKIMNAEEKIKSKLDSIIKSDSYRKYIQDSYVSVRNGRYVVPVKSEYRAFVKGSVIDSSGSSSTLFIEPEGIRNIQDELNLLKVQEENEIYKVLYYLMDIVETYRREISINIETMGQYDFAFAKAKYSRAMDGSSVEFNENNYMNIINGRHPLIESSPVPLDFAIGRDYRALVITGPNTGGKTVAIKTVGLLAMMAQSGLHVPADGESEFPVFTDILADIGDGQSIQESLSTFSSHIKNIISILECAGPGILVILDELGSGTDPQEGMGLAVSILETLYDSGATILATTHHCEIKTFAAERHGFQNGCMEFDINTLKPLYRLSIGKSGDSNAFLIALKLGMNKKVIERAHEVTYGESKKYGTENEEVKSPLRNVEINKFHDIQVMKVAEKERIEKITQKQQIENKFKIGDCVHINTIGRTGIVYELENSKGEIGVMYEKKKIKVNKKRLSLYIDSKELYPDEYDFDIVFETKENRKKRHLMDKHHIDGLTIEIQDGK